MLLSDYGCAAVLFMTDFYHLSCCAALACYHACSTYCSHRHDQDEFTVMSHTRAAAAHSNGFYRDEIIPVEGEGYGDIVRGIEREGGSKGYREGGRDIVRE